MAISVLLILAIIKIDSFSYTPLLELFLNICSMHIALRNLPGNFFLRFSASSAESKMAAKILCRSLELEPLPGFVFCLV